MLREDIIRLDDEDKPIQSETDCKLVNQSICSLLALLTTGTHMGLEG